MELTPNFTSDSFTYRVWKFPSGEIQVQLLSLVADQPVQIKGSILSSNHIIELLQLVDALGQTPKSLVMPYCAYSRQDRICNPGESLSLKVFAKLINSCNFTKVVTYDNHSDVSTALIDNCDNIPITHIFSTSLYEDNMSLDLNQYDYFVSPDAGANKKVFTCSQNFSIPMLRADKIRDTSTGSIIDTQVFATPNQLRYATVLIIDDICQGGRTFVELAKAIHAIESTCNVHLYVTHGFFTHPDGANYLLDNGIDRIITTNSVVPANEFDNVTLIQL